MKIAGQDAPAATRVVFVADDLGVSAGVNAGIAAAARGGLVQEASLCVTGRAVEDGVRIAQDLGLGIGLHLSLTLGRAITGPIAGLTDGDGRFRPLRPALAACLARWVRPAAIAAEIEAQLAELHRLVPAPTHADGHHHVHCWPTVREVAFAAFAQAGLRWTRLPAEHHRCRGCLRPVPWVVTRLARMSRPFAAAARQRALPFLGVTLERRRDFETRLLESLAALPAGDYECMVHPRRADPQTAMLDAGAVASVEAAVLASAATAEALQRAGVRAASFADVG